MSARCPVHAARLSALSLAMAARCGSFDLRELEALQDRMRTVDDTPLRHAIDAFATRIEVDGTGELALHALGTELLDAVERAARPDPVDAGRKDIHG
ncbi:hypothetical protein ACVDG3_08695 [Meridianimarinicoccus sp. RP-17]|uniref:hypothetical protein n=1 Tax=Meridianimarinicoccus zhengii TaxID=2056810 RepID=UPI000DAF192B|nr:hypothetical protein [Phycocomes zhengii]